MYVACPDGAVNAACGVPSTTALKIVLAPLIDSCAASDVPLNRATKPVPDQAKHGWSALVRSTRPSQRTPAATTPAGGGTGLLGLASVVGPLSGALPSGMPP